MNQAYQWKLLGVVLLMQGLLGGVVFYCFGFFVVQWMEEFSAERGLLMLAYTGMTLMNAAFSPMAGVLIDRQSSTVLVAIGLVAFICGLLLVSMAPGPYLILGAYILLYPFGLLLAGPLACQTLVVRTFATNRGAALGICALGATVGGVIMPIFVTQLLEIYDWRQLTQILAALVGLIVLPTAMLILRQAPRQERPKSDAPPKVSSRQFLRNADVYKIALASFVPSMFFMGVLLNLGLYAEDIGVSQAEASVIVSTAAGLMVVGKLSSGWLADRVNNGVPFYVLCGVISCRLYVTATADSFWPLALGVCILGTAVAGVQPFISTVVAQRFGADNYGSVMGLVLAAVAGAGISPMLAGWARDITGSYELAFLIFLPLLLPAVIAFSRLSKTPV